MIVRELLTKIGFKTDQASVDRFESSIKSTTVAITAMAAAASAATGAVFLLVKSAAATGDELDKVKDVIGLTTKQIQLLSGAAALSGVQHESFIRSMTFFTKAVGMARMGMMQQLKAFQMLGISLRGANGQVKSQIQLFNEVAEAMSKVKNVQDRAALSQVFFSRAGGKMLNMFKGGSKHIAEMTKQVEDLGFIMDKQGVKQSAKFTDQMFLASFAVKSLKEQIGLKLMPVFGDMLNKFLEWVKLNKTSIVANITSAFQDLVYVTKILGEGVSLLVGAFGGLVVVLKALAQPFHGAVITITAIAASVALLATPLGIVTAGFVAMLLVLDDINAYAEGKDSLIGRFISDFPQAAKALGEAFSGIKWVIENAIVEPLETAWHIIKLISGAFSFAAKGVNAVANVGSGQAPGGVADALSMITNPLAGAASLITRGVSSAFHVNTNVNVTVPAGSSASQQDFIATAAKGSFHDSLSHEIKKALTVFPGVER